ncbi:unnamed protein product [Boreogadus saida]
MGFGMGMIRVCDCGVWRVVGVRGRVEGGCSGLAAVVAARSPEQPFGVPSLKATSDHLDSQGEKRGGGSLMLRKAVGAPLWTPFSKSPAPPSSTEIYSPAEEEEEAEAEEEEELVLVEWGWRGWTLANMYLKYILPQLRLTAPDALLFSLLMHPEWANWEAGPCPVQ